MPTLPSLNSGTAAQYPLKRSIERRVATVSFLDGSEQRCATARPLHQWTLELSLLDERELNAFETFYIQQQGQAGQFSFTDPADGVVYPNCSFSVDSIEETFESHGRTKVTLTIRENQA